MRLPKAAPPISDKAGPGNAKKERFPKFTEWKPVIETVGIVFLIIYTAVTIGLWCESHRANKIAKDALMLGNGHG